MITRSVFLVLACCTYLHVIQTLLPKTMAIRITPNMDEFMIENQRTRTRQNYVVQRALDDGIAANIENLPPDTFGGTNPEELTAQIVDYANMIRNDIIFLDNSVETTTRKRGNIKKKDHSIPDLQCSCESESDVIDLGDNYYPDKIESRKCKEGSCDFPFRCKENYYYITIFKRSFLRNEKSPINFTTMDHQHHKWIPQRMNVTTSCACVRDVLELN